MGHLYTNTQTMTREQIKKAIIGKSEEEARAACEENGYKMRVVIEDGHHHAIKLDAQANRINVETKNGKVIKYHLG